MPLLLGAGFAGACQSPEQPCRSGELSPPRIEWSSARSSDSTRVRVRGAVWHCGPLRSARWFIETPESEGGVRETSLPWPVTYGELPGPLHNRLDFDVTLPARAPGRGWAYGIRALGADGGDGIVFNEYYSGATRLRLELPGLPASRIVDHPGLELIVGLHLLHRLTALEITLDAGGPASERLPLIDSSAFGKHRMFATSRVWLNGPLAGPHAIGIRAADESGTVRDTTVVLHFSVPERAHDVTFIPAPDGADVEPTDINNHAEVAANVRFAGAGVAAARGSGSAFVILEKPETTESSARAIGDAGVIVGDIDGRATLWMNGAAVPILPATLSGRSVALDINDRGQILVSRPLHEILLREADGTLATLASSIYCGDAARLNKQGRVVATSVSNSFCYSSAAVLLNPLGHVISPPPFWPPTTSRGDRFLAGYFINDDGYVIGAIDGRWFLTRNDTTRFLISPFGDATILGLNNRNQILARGRDGSAYVWTIDGATYKVVADPGWAITSFIAINDNEQVLGRALDPGGRVGAIILTPRAAAPAPGR